jgi:sulfur carrier protein ThiS
MFADFKMIAEVAINAYKALVGQQRREWNQLAKLFEEIGETLSSMATKYEGKVVPREEFVAIQMFADELHDCWENLPMSGKTEQVQQLSKILDEAITTAEGTDAEYFGFRAVPGPFYSRKEGAVKRKDQDADTPTPSVFEIREAATVFKTAATILRARGT